MKVEGRKLKASFYKSGSGSTSSKVNLPITDFRDMGVIPEDREFNYQYNAKNKIMILSKEDLSDYEIKLVKKQK